MKKIYIFTSASIFILILINIHIFNQYKNNNKIQKELSHITQENINKEIDLDIISKNRFYELSFNGKKIDKELTVYDTNNKEIKLSKIINENKLILRYSSLNCNTCIEEQLKNIAKHQDSIGINNIILFTTYQNIIHMNKFKKINKIKFKIYNLSKFLDKEIKDIGLPYFFVLEQKTMRSNCTFIPQRENNDLSNSYLKNIQINYFK